MISRHDVITAYKLVLGREPENDEVIESHRQNGSLEKLYNVFHNSSEFKAINYGRFICDSKLVKLDIEEDLAPDCKEQMFQITNRAWEKLGREEPYWSVLTHHKFSTNAITDEAIEEFYLSGKHDYEDILSCLKRHGISDISQKTVTEIGCGTGRVTYWAGKFFKKVIAYDISPGNIAIAVKKCASLSNVSFNIITKLEQYKNMDPTDLIFTFLVLQHNAPPVMKYILKCMFSALAENGIIIFQIPTFSPGYSFNFENYLENHSEDMEMHCLSQASIFKEALQNDCIPVEVIEDGYTGPGWLSNTFVFKKYGSSG